MRALLLALLLTCLPTVAHADAYPLIPVNIPGFPGTWILDTNSTIPVAINTVTGQQIFVMTSTGIPPGTYVDGNTLLVIVRPGGITGAFVPVPGAVPNLYNPPSTVITGPVLPSRVIPAPMAPNLWSPGQPLPDGAARDSNGPQTAPAAQPAAEHDSGSSPHQ